MWVKNKSRIEHVVQWSVQHIVYGYFNSMSDSSNICVISGSVLLTSFSGYIFLLLCISSNFLLCAGHCESYIVEGLGHTVFFRVLNLFWQSYYTSSLAWPVNAWLEAFLRQELKQPLPSGWNSPAPENCHSGMFSALPPLSCLDCSVPPGTISTLDSPVDLQCSGSLLGLVHPRPANLWLTIQRLGARAGSWAFFAQLPRLCILQTAQQPQFYLSLLSCWDIKVRWGSASGSWGERRAICCATSETVSACILCSSTVAYRRSVSLCPLHVS